QCVALAGWDARDRGAVAGDRLVEAGRRLLVEQDEAAEAGDTRVGRGGETVVASGSAENAAEAEPFGRRDRDGLEPILVRPGRVRPLVLEQRAVEAERRARAPARQQRRPPFAQRQLGADR